MGRYVTLTDLVTKYSQLTQISSVEIDSYHIAYAENQLDGMFAGYFTVPFSDNNMTAKDLALDLAYLSAGNIKEEDYKALYDRLLNRVMRIKNGDEGMVTVDGTILQSGGSAIWSTTKDYHPVFGMGSELDFTVDSEQVDDEYWSRQ